eukprot:TRINITY_DN14366_c0_g2_i1.p2 TRINITY_DN14366_c0_g2~~TRINITY_DN14366_c0_g2_i1.p2  ORF type:complete len:199 (+),score=46.38 TRINITY_DN14366_c0_g2_i1:75-671(+)
MSFSARMAAAQKKAPKPVPKLPSRGGARPTPVRAPAAAAPPAPAKPVARAPAGAAAPKEPPRSTVLLNTVDAKAAPGQKRVSFASQAPQAAKAAQPQKILQSQQKGAQAARAAQPPKPAPKHPPAAPARAAQPRALQELAASMELDLARKPDTAHAPDMGDLVPGHRPDESCRVSFDLFKSHWHDDGPPARKRRRVAK